MGISTWHWDLKDIPPMSEVERKKFDEAWALGQKELEERSARKEKVYNAWLAMALRPCEHKKHNTLAWPYLKCTHPKRTSPCCVAEECQEII